MTASRDNGSEQIRQSTESCHWEQIFACSIQFTRNWCFSSTSIDRLQFVMVHTDSLHISAPGTDQECSQYESREYSYYNSLRYQRTLMSFMYTGGNSGCSGFLRLEEGLMTLVPLQYPLIAIMLPLNVLPCYPCGYY